MTKEAEALIKRIESHPGLRERIEEILDIAENTSGELITADQAEEKAIEAVKMLGKELLREWAVVQHDSATDKSERC